MNKSIISLFVLISLTVFFLFSCGKSDKSDLTQKENTITTITAPAKDSTIKKDESKTSKEVSLSTEEQKKINIFFSNFSEAGLEPFKSDQITDEMLINFGVIHSYINNRKSFEKADNSKLKLKDEIVNTAAV